MPAKLRPRQEAFVREYVLDFNATRAALAAGYSEKTARQMGSENLSKPYIQEAIKQRLQDKIMTQEEALVRFAEQARTDMKDFLTIDDQGNASVDFLKAQKLNKLHLIKSITPTRYGTKVELIDPQAALRDVGKNLGMFKEQNINIEIDLTKLTDEQIERLAKGEDVYSVITNTRKG